MSIVSKSKKLLDLNKVKNIIFEDIDILLTDLDLDYETTGDNIFMCCPIHEGSDNPHGVSINRTSWRCWTRGCHEEYGMSIFGFVLGVMSKEESGITFSDVLSRICKIYNITGEESLLTDAEIKSDYENELSEIIKIFKKKEEEEICCDVYDVKTSGRSEYFESRGFLPSTLAHFEVADCDDKTSPMYRRSIIPVHFICGMRAGFIARAMKEYIVPKYLYSTGFKKSHHLYNYHNAINTAQKLSCLFLTEGQGDVWRLYEAGVINCVGLFGKDVSDLQADKLIKSGVTKLVILTDNDQAGRESKVKIQRRFSRMFNLVFPVMSKKDIGNMSIKEVDENILSQAKGLY